MSSFVVFRPRFPRSPNRFAIFFSRHAPLRLASSSPRFPGIGTKNELFLILRKLLRDESTFSSGDLLWCAPEHLRDELPLRRGSQKGDVYSFAIIMQEIITRSSPFENLDKYSRHFLPPEEILFRVKLGSNPPFRPDVTPEDCPKELLSLMKLCWNESPALRPSFSIVKQLMKKYTKYVPLITLKHSNHKPHASFVCAGGERGN